MSPTVKSASTGDCARAAAPQTPKTNRTKTARGFMHDRRCVSKGSIELAHDVVEQRDAHEQYQKCNPDLLTEELSTLGERIAFEPFDQLEYDLPAVENRDRQQVQEPKTQRNQHQEAEKG